MKPESHTVAEIYERLQVMIRQRNDTGFRLAVSDAVLEPKNPFEPKKGRRPKAAVAVASSLFFVLASIFVYFSFQKGR